MKLFEMDGWEVKIQPEALTLEPFKKIYKRDRSKTKVKAVKEMAFIYHFTDIRSDYMIIADEEDRAEEVRKGVLLPEDWKMDKVVKEAIEFYKEHSKTIILKLYEDAMISANAIGSYLRQTDALLKERDDNGKAVTTIQTIVAALNNVNKLIKELKVLEKEIIKESKSLEGKSKGSQSMSMYEDGLNIE